MVISIFKLYMILFSRHPVHSGISGVTKKNSVLSPRMPHLASKSIESVFAVSISHLTFYCKTGDCNGNNTIKQK